MTRLSKVNNGQSPDPRAFNYLINFSFHFFIIHPHDSFFLSSFLLHIFNFISKTLKVTLSRMDFIYLCIEFASQWSTQSVIQHFILFLGDTLRARGVMTFSLFVSLFFFFSIQTLQLIKRTYICHDRQCLCRSTCVISPLK